MKRLLTSLCGILLIASIVLTSNCLDTETSQQSHGMLFKALLIILNLVFVLAFLASTLVLIKEENKS